MPNFSAIGEQQRQHDDDRREDVHDRADEQQDHVDREQEHDLRVNVILRPRDELVRDLGVDHEVGQRGRREDDDEDRADHRDRLAAGPPQTRGSSGLPQPGTNREIPTSSTTT